MTDYVGTRYIAEGIDVTIHHVGYLIRNGKIKADKISGSWLVKRDIADQFIADYLENPPTTSPKRKQRPETAQDV